MHKMNNAWHVIYKNRILYVIVHNTIHDKHTAYKSLHLFNNVHQLHGACGILSHSACNTT